ncbi:acyltransferase [Blastococcus mobilis]|uniref:Acetyltransferase (Isoleucine patch superfamily) n=1 Tax=Blastococcus mobilis TaxID=1938746 RepID=A0A239AME1_9ACTN|nr:hypothetical protein [Blastococcus mobilis]SNR96827.1 Acetyltransferase (isoleucine patch superfamily) [Blastococcus mobilis]
MGNSKRVGKYAWKQGVEALIADLIAILPSHIMRLALYRHVMGMRLGSGVTIYRGAKIRYGRGITIGDGTTVGEHARLDGRSGLVIGRQVNLSSEVAIWTLQHDAQSTSFATTGGQVTVGDYAWLSARSTVLPRVSIGRGAVVAAHAVVTADVAEFAIVGGVPAKMIGVRNTDLSYSLDYRIPFM